jgi:hypothetical protein
VDGASIRQRAKQPRERVRCTMRSYIIVSVTLDPIGQGIQGHFRSNINKI